MLYKCFVLAGLFPVTARPIYENILYTAANEQVIFYFFIIKIINYTILNLKLEVR